MTLLRHIIPLAALMMTACSGKGGSTAVGPDSAAVAATTPVTADIPRFDADSAYSHIAAQVAFGPRVPGSRASADCADWIVERLAAYGATDIRTQHATLQAWDGTSLPARNISATIANPLAKDRVVLVAHWDSRPWADMEADPDNRETPIDGANDGASGVAVILEIARALQGSGVTTGVDVLLVDAEDYGRRADMPYDEADETSWCLGTQHWLSDPTLNLDYTRCFILLDMVGGRGAVFPREYYSERYAPEINDLIWGAAAAAGYADRFADITGTGVVDDHIFLMRTGIPAIDIIETQTSPEGGFNPTWHTHADNLENIDKTTLQAVGQTLIHAISRM